MHESQNREEIKRQVIKRERDQNAARSDRSRVVQKPDRHFARHFFVGVIIQKLGDLGALEDLDFVEREGAHVLGGIERELQNGKAHQNPRFRHAIQLLRQFAVASVDREPNYVKLQNRLKKKILARNIFGAKSAKREN